MIEDGLVIHGFATEALARQFVRENGWRLLLALSSAEVLGVLGDEVTDERVWYEKQPNVLVNLDPR